jgi:N-methylhydantoinase A
MHRIGIDVGGTFTDYVAITPNGRFVSGKTPSTPGEESVAVLNAIDKIADTLGLSSQELLAQTEVVNFGSTVATNAMLEHKGASVGMITTKGFRDIIALRRGYKESLFDIRLSPPPPIVRRRHRKGVTERIDFEGNVVIPLVEDEVRGAVDELKDEGITSYAVCFLQSPVNPAHEMRCAEIIAERHPDAFVTTSSEVLRRIGEFERFSTTVINAYLSSILRGYMSQLEQTLVDRGFKGRLLIMQSNGGTASIEDISRQGVSALLSGPAGGVVAASQVGTTAGVVDVIGVDMGGTSYDVSLIRGGRPEIRMDTWVARYQLALPILDIHTIGAGGGSIAWIDAGGALRVGPQSAGARPGPACYGRGGSEPTVTDANLLLGYLPSESALAGEIKLDHRLAEDAVHAKIAEPLGMSVLDAAIGIFRIVNNNMSNGIRYVTVARGHDPRDFALLAFGGAAATHAQVQSRDLGIRTILVPKGAGVLSAYGTILADLKVSAMAPYLREVENVDLDELNLIFKDLWERNRVAVTAGDVERIERRFFADFRYVGQVHELTIPVPSGDGTIDPHDWKASISDFHKTHEQLYTFQLPDKPVEVITLREDLLGVRPKPEWKIEARPDEPADSFIKTMRSVYIPAQGSGYEFVNTPVYDGTKLLPGHVISGPAVIEEANTTIVLYATDHAELNEYGTYVISVGEEPVWE